MAQLRDLSTHGASSAERDELQQKVQHEHSIHLSKRAGCCSHTVPSVPSVLNAQNGFCRFPSCRQS